MSTVNFVPKPFKTHIKIHKDFDGYFFLWAFLGGTPCPADRTYDYSLARHYCMTVNDGEYSTPGEAARALFSILNYRG
jgi:hypothetical protein